MKISGALHQKLDFAFQLTMDEFASLMLQIATSKTQSFFQQGFAFTDPFAAA
jgi:hypothetical protein